jgi:hypothetical protein
MRVLALIPLLAACAADLPPAAPSGDSSGGPGGTQREAWPRLVPIDAILAEAGRPGRAGAAGEALAGRGAGVAARAGALPDPAPIPPDRAQALRARAEALRAAPL